MQETNELEGNDQRLRKSFTLNIPINYHSGQFAQSVTSKIGKYFKTVYRAQIAFMFHEKKLKILSTQNQRNMCTEPITKPDTNTTRKF